MTNPRFTLSLFTALALAAAIAVPGAQSAPPAPAAPAPAPPVPRDSSAGKKATPPAKGSKALTLIGCVQPEEGTRGAYTLTDESTGTIYHLTGTSVKPYVWRHVQIVGGLVPSATAAAQAGAAFDPVKAAEAAEGSRPAAATTPAVDVRVNRVQPLAGGACAPKTN
jgi:hypothetical protein